MMSRGLCVSHCCVFLRLQVPEASASAAVGMMAMPSSHPKLVCLFLFVAAERFEESRDTLRSFNEALTR